MSLSEQLIVAAKNGNTKEVRKLLAKKAPVTKDQVGLPCFSARLPFVYLITVARV